MPDVIWMVGLAILAAAAAALWLWSARRASRPQSHDEKNPIDIES